MRILLLMLLTVNSFSALSNPLDYDVIYVRYPAQNPDGGFVTIPQGEKAYDIAAGADLVLLKSDGREIVIVDCDDCSVMDPMVSFDAKTVYYSLIVDIPYGAKATLTQKRATASWLYKIHLDDPDFTPIRLTFNDGFDSHLYKGNTTNKHDQSVFRGIRDMAPVPLADGRLLFTSNRAATTALRPGTDAVVNGSVQHLYVMTDHEGQLDTKELASIRELDKGSLSLVQHPMQLKDGRILFSTWQPVAHKFLYAMTNLFTIHPDGTNITQFTEPHDRNKFVEHFITQLPNEDVVAGYYYPSFDYGYGLLTRLPVAPKGLDWLKGNMGGDSRRGFQRKGAVNITPHTTAQDLPAPNRSGKYSMPSVGANDSLLVAYSKGWVNHFNPACKKEVYMCEDLRSGIYMIQNASNTIITDPSKLVLIKDDPKYNEIWPRAVLSYDEIYGIKHPSIIPNDLSNTNGATALLGTSSMYNRESEGFDGPTLDPDPFHMNVSREINTGNWMIQGSDAGIYRNADIHAVRILATPAKPFTKPISIGPSNKKYKKIRPLLEDKRLRDVVARYGSFHNERWEILGEFELPHRDKKDLQGNPDTSWVAEVPADTPLLIQALDRNGMTLNSELTWRGLQPGEKRVDCAGCHAHSISGLEYQTTASGKQLPIQNIRGIDNLDNRIKGGVWNISTGTIPVLTDKGTEFINQQVLGVEFSRDVYPILQNNCVGCHQTGGNTPNLAGNPIDVYKRLIDKTNPVGRNFSKPQMSKYIRSPQARQSLLTWIIYGERLDGRTNETRKDDIDFPMAHPALKLKNEDQRIVARWIDLGGPIDFPGDSYFAYTKDAQLPVVKKVYLADKPSRFANHFSVGVIDANSGIDWGTLKISYYDILKPFSKIIVHIDKELKIDEFDVVHIPLANIDLEMGAEFILKIEVNDIAGNRNVFTEKLSKS